MTTPLATPATTDSSTLYFGPWYRRSPFFEKTLAAGCSAHDIYNHIYLLTGAGNPLEIVAPDSGTWPAQTASIPFLDAKKQVPLG
jgi:hypothetical protein